MKLTIKAADSKCGLLDLSPARPMFVSFSSHLINAGRVLKCDTLPMPSNERNLNSLKQITLQGKDVAAGQAPGWQSLKD